MINKLLIIALFGVLGLFVGKLASKITKEKVDYIVDALDLVESIISDISCLKDGVFYVITNFNFKSDSLKNDVTKFIDTHSFSASARIDKRAKTAIEEIFLSLCIFDDGRQLEVLKSKKCVLKAIVDEKCARLNKEYGAFIKLGFLAGLCVGVLMI